MTLPVAIAAAKEQRWAQAAKAALDAWRSAPAPDLAELIDRIEALVSRQPYAGSGKKLRAAVLADDPQAVPRFGPLLPELQRDEAESVLRRALTLPRDPRWGTVLAGWLGSPPFISGHFLWKAVAELLEHTADDRLSQTLQRPIGEVLPYELYGAMSAPWDRLALRSADWAKGATPGIAPLQAAIEVGEATARANRALRDELFARFVADPEDTGAVAVLADLLQQDDDPRGELMVLQGSLPGAPERARIKALIRDYGVHLSGPLAPFVLKRGRRFAHGYLESAVLRFKKPTQMEALGDCSMAGTLRDVDLDGTVSWADRRSPWALALHWLPGLRRARAVQNALGLHALLTHPGVEVIEAQASQYDTQWKMDTTLSREEIRTKPLQQLWLPPQAISCLRWALGRGVGIERLVWCIDPNARFAESIKYGPGDPGLTLGIAHRLIAKTPRKGIRRVTVLLGFRKNPIAELEATPIGGRWELESGPELG